MSTQTTIGEVLRNRGMSRRSFLQFCAATASLLALPPSMVPRLAQALEQARRPSVLWLEFQACTGCTETLTRSDAPTLENLLFDVISLDSHDTLQAAAGHAAEAARTAAMKENWGNYLLLVDGSLPLGNPGYSTIGGVSNVELLKEAAKGAFAVVAVGSCAAFGGLPYAAPNPTGAVPVSAVVKDKPVINVSGCPPIPVVLTGVLAHYLTFGTLPALDKHGRPNVFFAQTIHDRCYRRPFYERGQFAESFDDEGAKQGWCLYKLGCKGPVTYNACATVKWNQGVSFPIEAGHGCIGCSEPNFWDKGSFYRSLPQGDWGSAGGLAAAAALGAGVAVGTSLLARHKLHRTQKEENS
jgi:hydrogenase small subunit